MAARLGSREKKKRGWDNKVFPIRVSVKFSRAVNQILYPAGDNDPWFCVCNVVWNASLVENFQRNCRLRGRTRRVLEKSALSTDGKAREIFLSPPGWNKQTWLVSIARLEKYADSMNNLATAISEKLSNNLAAKSFSMQVFPLDKESNAFVKRGSPRLKV